ESAGADGPLVDDGLLDQLVDLLRTPSGAFRFTEGALARPDRVATPDPDLLPRAIERLHDWEALADAVPSLSLLVKLRNNTAPGPSEVTLSSAAWAVSVAVSSGQASVAAVAKHLHWSAFETCQAVRELVDAGRAVLAPPPKRRRGRRAGAAVSGPGVWHPANQPLWPGAGGDERDRFSAAWAFDE
ncbi:MAG: hypothetical protein QOI20_1507, partial [Acidimicrobiaceae bacterium]|nr:hypothetical protein [Acidimicrobiaceae bacterium]